MSKRRIFQTVSIVLAWLGLAITVYGIVTLVEKNKELNHKVDLTTSLNNDLTKKNKSLSDDNEKLHKRVSKDKKTHKLLIQQISRDKVKMHKKDSTITKYKRDVKKLKSLNHSLRQENKALKKKKVSTVTNRDIQAIGHSAKSVQVTATAYIAMCETGCTGITATGINLKDNPYAKVIAVDPRVIPLGSKVYVEGYGTAIAGDTGGAIKGNKIDIHMPTTRDARQWGVRSVKVTILN